MTLHSTLSHLLTHCQQVFEFQLITYDILFHTWFIRVTSLMILTVDDQFNQWWLLSAKVLFYRHNKYVRLNDNGRQNALQHENMYRISETMEMRSRATR